MVHRKNRLASALAALVLSAWAWFPATAGAVPSQQPFAPTSPWNAALPAGLQYTNASCDLSLRDPAATPWINAGRYSIPVYQATNSDPSLNVFVNGQYMGSPHVPVNATPAVGTDQHLVLIEPDGIHSDEFWKTTINRAAGTITAGAASRYDLTGTGIGGSALVGYGPRASNLSGLGGLIRSSDVQAGTIAHALALAVPPGDMAKGWVWPADGEDDGAVEASYAGNIHMGQLVTIPASVDLSVLGLSPLGLQIAKALQRYGAYVVDAGDAVALYAEPPLESSLGGPRVDMAKLRTLMRCTSLPVVANPYPAAVKADHPLAYYRLDETGGTRMASQVGPGADGTYSGTPTFGRPGALSTDPNPSVAFDGADSAAMPVAPRQNVTLELWVKSTDNVGTTPAQWWTGEALIDGDSMGVAYDYGTSMVAGKAVFHVGDPANNRDVTIASTTSINDGAWHQVVATRNALTGTLSLYVDRRLEATAAGPTGRRYAISGLTLGSLQSGPGDFLRGSVDEVAVYNQALSTEAVARHYDAAIPSH